VLNLRAETPVEQEWGLLTRTTTSHTQCTIENQTYTVDRWGINHHHRQSQVIPGDSIVIDELTTLATVSETLPGE